MRRDYGCCGTEKPAKRGEVESPLRLGQRPNECDALANRASCEAHPVAHVNTRQGLSALQRYLLYMAESKLKGQTRSIRMKAFLSWGQFFT